jgi:preprotein translocase subunit SecG
MFMFVRFMLGFMLVATSIFLILLVLIQRGRGGGLAGALGGMGGQSAFGTKAGDLFTKITIGVATFWILLCILSINVLGTQQSLFSSNLGGSAPEALEGLGTTEAVPAATEPVETPAEPAAEKPADAEAGPDLPGAADAAPESTPPATPATEPPTDNGAAADSDTAAPAEPAADGSEDAKPAE